MVADRKQSRAIERLQRKYATIVQHVILARRICPWYCLANPALAIDNAIVEKNKDPFWAANWAAGFALADYVAVKLHHGPLNFLELGCGSGLVSVAASLLGHQVLATDIASEALLLTAANADLNGACLQVRRLDWHDRGLQTEQFDHILAADVAYDRNNFAAIEQCLRVHLKADGTAFIAEPNRGTGDEFIMFLRSKAVRVDLSMLTDAVRLLKCRYD